jgi:hypothetical protein
MHRERVPQDAVVGPPKLVGAVVSDLLSERGGTDEVGEQNGGGLGATAPCIGHGLMLGVGATVRLVGPPHEVAEAVAEVAEPNNVHDTVLFRSTLDARLWVQISRIKGEDLLLCEAVSDEYVGRHEELADGVLSQLRGLGWGDDAGSDYTRWEAGSSDAERGALASLVWQTLVEAYGQDADRPPAIDFP